MKKGQFKYTIDNNKIDLKNPIYCYIIGLISTDGYVDVKNSRICIRMRNKGIKTVFKRLSKYLKFTGPIFSYNDNKDFELRISSLHWIKELQKLNLHLSKSKIPFIVFSKEQNMKMYIRGLHDGDGNIKRHKVNRKWKGGEFRFTNSNKKFQVDFKNWLESKFLEKVNLREVKRKNNTFYELSTSVKLGKEFAKWFYTDFKDYKIHTKYLKFKSIFN